ncbi:cbb3-type cytochrome c oxidase N-terminal domain-containing protein [Flavobacterium caeni]|uniref:Cytochrome c oxidase cbb3-type subunit 3 n=1 Tax=Flavobacterium caeni TaxID=490189 RepID=A0A1G5CYP0_9FLAO|nr:cbb3-type cytochrome c oxidase N-terminal domain-containing protein [Flavobacterium caeni]SCY07522.1 cytochrome c oxidase cbb3-type subunit 3 [Flavobacterium caeni]
MKQYFPAWLRVPVFFFTAFGLIEFLVDSGDRPAFMKYPIIMLVLFIFLFVLVAFEIMNAAIANIIYQLLSDDEKKQRQYEEDHPIPLTQRVWYKRLMEKLTRSQPIENEAVVMMSHNYDGIQELDNRLPPWWTYLFYGCIVFSVVYLVKYEMLGGDDQETELRKEMAQAKIDVAQYMLTAPDQMDESKVTQLTAPDELAKGKSIYDTNCAACHRADGGGQIGPNLTDAHWIFGGSIKNLFHTITNGGRDGKGMVAWNTTLKPTEIQYVASYILSLQGTNPKDAKAAEGDLWVDPEKQPAEPKK